MHRYQLHRPHLVQNPRRTPEEIDREQQDRSVHPKHIYIPRGEEGAGSVWAAARAAAKAGDRRPFNRLRRKLAHGQIDQFGRPTRRDR